jgi:hypothetical protein
MSRPSNLVERRVSEKGRILIGGKAFGRFDRSIMSQIIELHACSPVLILSLAPFSAVLAYQITSDIDICWTAWSRHTPTISLRILEHTPRQRRPDCGLRIHDQDSVGRC